MGKVADKGTWAATTGMSLGRLKLRMEVAQNDCVGIDSFARSGEGSPA